MTPAGTLMAEKEKVSAIDITYKHIQIWKIKGTEAQSGNQASV
jgi:hypothetical protein